MAQIQTRAHAPTQTQEQGQVIERVSIDNHIKFAGREWPVQSLFKDGWLEIIEIVNVCKWPAPWPPQWYIIRLVAVVPTVEGGVAPLTAERVDVAPELVSLEDLILDGVFVLGDRAVSPSWLQYMMRLVDSEVDNAPSVEEMIIAARGYLVIASIAARARACELKLVPEIFTPPIYRISLRYIDALKRCMEKPRASLGPLALADIAEEALRKYRVVAKLYHLLRGR